MSVAVAGRCDDIIDSMLTRSHGLVLRAPSDSTSGEYDSWRQGFSRRDVRRLVGAGLIAVDGERADVLADLIDGWSGNGDELVTWWMSTGLQGLDLRAARRARADVVERPESDWSDVEAIAIDDLDSADRLMARLLLEPSVPAWFMAWCERTVHAPKLAALAELGAARWLGEPAARATGAAWFDKLARKFETRCKS